MSSVKLNHVKSSVSTALCRSREFAHDLVHISPTCRSGYLIVSRPGYIRGGQQAPVICLKWYVHPFPTQSCRTLGPCVSQLQAHLSLRMFVHKRNNSLPARALFVVPYTSTSRGYPACWRHHSHFRKNQSSTTQCARTQVNQMKVTGYSFHRRIHSHG